MTVTDDRMQKRRDTFLMHTDEKPPAEPKRWLVVWVDIDVHGTKWQEWSNYEVEDDARRRAAGMSGKVYDLDAGW